MKTTFDLAQSLVRKAKALAAHQGRPLRDLVAEAIDEKLQRAATAREAGAGDASATPPLWKAYAARLKRQPDGTWLNPKGIDDDSFFANLDAIRGGSAGWTPHALFEDE